MVMVQFEPFGMVHRTVPPPAEPFGMLHRTVPPPEPGSGVPMPSALVGHIFVPASNHLQACNSAQSKKIETRS